MFSPGRPGEARAFVSFRGDALAAATCTNGSKTAIQASLSGGTAQPGAAWRPGQTSVSMPLAKPSTGSVDIEMR